MADPAGNRTAFITDPVPARLHAALGAAVVADEELDAEQAGFITMPGPGHPGHLQMSGGEFCGNASRSFGYLIGREQHMRTGEKVTITVSGAGEPLQVTMGEGGAEACMPLPEKTGRIQVPRSDSDSRGRDLSLCGICGHYPSDSGGPGNGFRPGRPDH